TEMPAPPVVPRMDAAASPAAFEPVEARPIADAEPLPAPLDEGEHEPALFGAARTRDVPLFAAGSSRAPLPPSADPLHDARLSTIDAPDEGVALLTDDSGLDAPPPAAASGRGRLLAIAAALVAIAGAAWWFVPGLMNPSGSAPAGRSAPPPTAPPS